MSKYTAQVHLKTDDEWTERMQVMPTFKTIAQVKDWVLRTQDDMDQVREVTILRVNKQGNCKIHGFYDWNGKQLVLGKNRDAWVHNVLYGL